jgi:hypothetical protein
MMTLSSHTAHRAATRRRSLQVCFVSFNNAWVHIHIVNTHDKTKSSIRPHSRGVRGSRRTFLNGYQALLKRSDLAPCFGYAVEFAHSALNFCQSVCDRLQGVLWARLTLDLRDMRANLGGVDMYICMLVCLFVCVWGTDMFFKRKYERSYRRMHAFPVFLCLYTYSRLEVCTCVRTYIQTH